MNNTHTYPHHKYHFLFINKTISINIIHIKYPFQFLFNITTQHHTQPYKKLFKIHSTILIYIKNSKHIFNKNQNISPKNPKINILKLFNNKITTIPTTSIIFLIPLLNFINTKIHTTPL